MANVVTCGVKPFMMLFEEKNIELLIIVHNRIKLDNANQSIKLYKVCTKRAVIGDIKHLFGT